MSEHACWWRSGRAVAIVLAGLTLSSPASAQSVEEGRIGAGHSATVALHYHLVTTGCRSGPTPAIRVRQRPRLGRLATSVRTIRLPAGGPLAPNACAGRPVRAVVVRYTAGRRPGTDAFTYDFTFPRERVTRSKSVRVTIQ